MKQLEEVKARLGSQWGLRWSDEVSKMARRHLEKKASNTLDTAFSLLNGETYFFRYPVYLQVIRERMRRHIALGGRQYRVLSAGCSTGEEAYTLAFALSEEARVSGCKLEIIGVDVRPAAIRAAHTGKYRKWSLRNRKGEGLEEFLKWDGAAWEVQEKYRNMVRFQVQNLLEPFAMEKVHGVITCNVLLYMHEMAVAQVYGNLDAVLDAEGILMIAPTDPLPPPPWRLMQETAGWPVFLRNAQTRSVSPPAGATTTPVRPARKTKASESRISAPKATNSFEAGRPATRGVPAPPEPLPAELEEQSDSALWLAWARGELSSAAEQVRRKLFFEPEHPMWRFLNGVILWENGWLRKSAAEIRKANALLDGKPTHELLAEVCTVEELRRVIDFWRQQHG